MLCRCQWPLLDIPFIKFTMPSTGKPQSLHSHRSQSTCCGCCHRKPMEQQLLVANLWGTVTLSSLFSNGSAAQMHGTIITSTCWLSASMDTCLPFVNSSDMPVEGGCWKRASMPTAPLAGWCWSSSSFGCLKVLLEEIIWLVEVQVMTFLKADKLPQYCPSSASLCHPLVPALWKGSQSPYN